MRGTLLSHDALASMTSQDAAPRVSAAQTRLRAVAAVLQREAGPAWPARLVFDRIASPVCRALGFDVVPVGGSGKYCHGLLHREGPAAAVVIAFPFGQEPGALWRQSVRAGIGTGVRWCYCFTGPSVRVFDAARTHSRRFVEFDLLAIAETETLAVALRVLGGPQSLDAAVALSERHRTAVRDGLQSGVKDALTHLTGAFATAARGRRARERLQTSLLDESLVVVYRVLFLLFAEARGLVPVWHPTFREGYTIDALRNGVETVAPPRGIWEALQAIARLAHRGCRAGSLQVPPFNGRLFSPLHAPLADTVPLDEGAVRNALLALTTRQTSDGRERIGYADLGVEHLGGVYERVLDYDVSTASEGTPTLVRGGRRKASGSFYTPRSLTEYLVRRTLTPLTVDATPDEILSLRVLDPAMGSGAFLVAACRYLAHAYELALIRSGAATTADLSGRDRAGFRRVVAQRCLYGVDFNPMAAQLARLSLWLTTMSGDRPLTFFDHHLRSGNSLAGASLADVRQKRSGKPTSTAPLPLLDGAAIDSCVGDAVRSRALLREGLEDTIEQIRAKEALFEASQAPGAPLGRLKAVADLWCAGWFDPDVHSVPRATFAALIDDALGRGGALNRATTETVVSAGRQSAERDRFFHWELEFPDVFHGHDGQRLHRPGFDAILGNPPWEMLRGDTGDAEARRRKAGDGSRLTKFARGSGIYRLQGAGHANLYQLFAERTLSLLRRGGRLGLVLPSGFATDHGCAPLRRHVLDSTSIDSFVVVENRESLFPIHRAVKFVLLTLTKPRDAATRGTDTLPLRCGIRSAADFDALPDTGEDPRAVRVPRRLIEQLSGEQLAVPELRTAADAAIAARIAFRFPACGDAAGWNLRFGRELNASDDRASFNQAGIGMPVVEGKHIGPFALDISTVSDHIEPGLIERAIGRRPFERSRLAYRDVASSTNRLTLIAAILPAGVITTHTLFCLRDPPSDEVQQFLAGMFNSFVANFMIRLRVTTHVTVAIVERLPVPRPPAGSLGFAAVARLAQRLASNPGHFESMARLQATAARLYELDVDGFAHVLTTFPLVDPALRDASMRAFIGTI